ncbi:1-aminocyclopropane-1-carboxylate deaminase/D-cysteine desulfhydrase [Gilvimarinus sp. 1_MG-2023]|uniref:1-aminocyclopropane-1-carboxylate deaminase/D-cysteine desulfhydrase n=1 Tax=Gilvimarinus sp. 1_MG-2023 TaxID=3062638 RepID=UPI0026E42415|nr:pyridoxal-phosphate dependent enzyme [Gilvimarinus sp. 1_MG-2023]MDO6745883.1 pyridoxal-phosphate dependent enzyme [Gilvimarinus sp. 1_MG-2023]
MSAQMPESALLERAMMVPYQAISMPNTTKRGLKLLMRRDDLIDPNAIGNKFYKLYFNINHAIKSHKRRLVTMGGPWSNHLLACAQAARKNGMQSRALIRGKHHKFLSQTLQDCQSLGMQLDFVSTTEYQSLTNLPHSEQASLPDKLLENRQHDYFIPEGGCNDLGVNGCQYIGQAIRRYSGTPSSVCVAVGTGGTFRGVVQGLGGLCHTLGVAVLKNTQKKTNLLGLDSINHQPWSLAWGFDLGGYGRRLPAQAVNFWRAFEQNNQIAIDPVYTLKMLWGVDQLARLGYWKTGDTVIVIHTGGLQGRRGFSQQMDWPTPKPVM